MGHRYPGQVPRHGAVAASHRPAAVRRCTYAACIDITDRQERSLSTILYLLSLTELSRSPFSLVDEINQGMDPRAERSVHDQMVEITCRPEAGQYVQRPRSLTLTYRYFLITPKLLSGLRYDELMKVLLINNGEWLPERLNCTYTSGTRALAHHPQWPTMSHENPRGVVSPTVSRYLLLQPDRT